MVLSRTSDGVYVLAAKACRKRKTAFSGLQQDSSILIYLAKVKDILQKRMLAFRSEKGKHLWKLQIL